MQPQPRRTSAAHLVPFQWPKGVSGNPNVPAYRRERIEAMMTQLAAEFGDLGRRNS
jgi:hypothetical protein